MIRRGDLQILGVLPTLQPQIWKGAKAAGDEVGPGTGGGWERRGLGRGQGWLLLSSRNGRGLWMEWGRL